MRRDACDTRSLGTNAQCAPLRAGTRQSACPRIRAIKAEKTSCSATERPVEPMDCVVVLGGRPPACVLRLATDLTAPVPFLSFPHGATPGAVLGGPFFSCSHMDCISPPCEQGGGGGQTKFTGGLTMKSSSARRDPNGRGPGLSPRARSVPTDCAALCGGQPRSAR